MAPASGVLFSEMALPLRNCGPMLLVFDRMKVKSGCRWRGSGVGTQVNNVVNDGMPPLRPRRFAACPRLGLTAATRQLPSTGRPTYSRPTILIVMDRSRIEGFLRLHYGTARPCKPAAGGNLHRDFGGSGEGRAERRCGACLAASIHDIRRQPRRWTVPSGSFQDSCP